MAPDTGRWVTAVAVAGGIWISGWVLVHFTLKPLGNWFRRSKTSLDDILFQSVRRHIPIWFLALGLDVGSRWAPLSPGALYWLDRILLAIVVLSISFAVASFLTRLLSRRAAPGLEILPANTLIQNLIRFIVLTLGVLVILGQMGVAIAPLLTALGVGSLAVALALQPTLTNLFAGLNILLSHQIRVGDFVELEGGQGGVVTDIGWRSTAIEELPGNTFVIPNARFSEMIVKNYNLPSSEHSLAVEIRLAPAADLDEVEEIARQTALEVQRSVPGAVRDYQPGVIFRSFGDIGVVLAVNLRVRDYRDRGPVVHELIKRIHRRFEEKGIEISVAPRHVTPATATRPAPGPGASPPA